MSDADVLKRRYERERQSRLSAEQLLEEKSLQLYSTNEELRELGESLQQRVETRTRELEQSNRELLKATRARERFLTNITHELRSPLQGIIGFANLGLNRVEKVDRSKLAKYFKTVGDSGQTLLALVNDLLDLSKMNADSLELDLDSYNLTGIIGQIEDEFRLRAKERKLTITLPDDTAINALVDQLRIGQVVRNLLSNAVKFSDPGSTIELQLSSDDTNVVFSIKNQGPGIPDGETADIFNPFVESSTTANKSGGTGLGLAICQKIIELHNGTIWLEDASVNTCFRFTLPSAPAAEIQAAA